MHCFGVCAFMRQSFALMLAAFLSFACSAHAETVKVGGSSVDYSIPKGYVAASGLAYDPTYKFIHDSPPDVVIGAIYAPESVDRLVRASGLGDLNQYLVVAYKSALEDASFSAQEFETIRQAVKSVQIGDVEGSVSQRIRQGFEKLGTTANHSTIAVPLGIIEEGEAHISALFLLKRRAAHNEDSADVTQAMIARVILGNGKLVQTYLYKTVADEAEAMLFQSEALAVLDSMNFKKNTAWDISPSWRNVGLQLLAFGIMAISATLIFLWLRYKRRSR